MPHLTYFFFFAELTHHPGMLIQHKAGGKRIVFGRKTTPARPAPDENNLQTTQQVTYTYATNFNARSLRQIKIHIASLYI